MRSRGDYSFIFFINRHFYRFALARIYRIVVCSDTADFEIISTDVDNVCVCVYLFYCFDRL